MSAPVDLEQFRLPVEAWKSRLDPNDDDESEAYDKADRLLSIIDSAVLPSATNAIIGSVSPEMQQPAPVVDDAMRELIGAADKAKRAYWLARNSAAGLTNYCEESANSRRCERELAEAERIYRDSGFEAALTRAQEALS